jgi:putative membrane protein
MDYMFQTGFLGTRAPFFMDVVTLIVAILPLLVFGAILLARKGYPKLHMIAQNIIFVVSLVVIAYFEVGVRVGGGFDAFVSDTGVSHTYALWVLIVHIIIAVVTLIYWTLTMIGANMQYAKKELPGRYSVGHRVLAVKATLGIILTSLSGIWVYLLLFVY